jgi:type IV pilus assembly protein PilB
MPRSQSPVTESATNLVNAYLEEAVRLGASDIHIEPDPTHVRIRFRIDGTLREAGNEDIDFLTTIISRIKVQANLDISESRIPQDGRFQLKWEGRELDVRVSTFPTSYGECAVLRLLDLSRAMLTFDQLGVGAEDLARLQRMVGRPNGLVLVTGPTGSGKTTTLFSFLNSITTPEKCIVTLEDPIEYRLPYLRQTQVDHDTGLTFAKGLRGLFRQNPDVIMVGEVRDRETAQIAVEAALTGHLVLTTIHTNDAIGALARLMNMGTEPFLLGSALVGVVAQRLVRKVCQSCAVEFHPPATLLRELGVDDLNASFKRGGKCTECAFSGYRGRMGIFEVLEMTKELETMLIAGESLDSIEEKALGAGMRSLRENGLVLARAGVTTLEEVVRLTREN